MSGADASTFTADQERFTWGLISDVFEVLERHGYRRGDHAHVGHAVGLLLDLAETYERRNETAEPETDAGRVVA